MEDRILREPEVGRRTQLSRTTRWRQERKGKFPQRLQLSENAVGWLESEIRAWIESRAARRREVLPGAGQSQQAGQRETRPDEDHHNLARRLSRPRKNAEDQEPKPPLLLKRQAGRR